VMCESVNVFVPDKATAMCEYVRVVKPGGHIGMNEAIWVNNPSEKIEEIIVQATGQQFQSTEMWESLLMNAGLVGLVIENHPLAMREEARNQTGLLSFGSYLRILGRAFKVLLTDKETRSLLKYMSSNPRQYFEYMGYGLYVGRKPQ
jgi:ubiquinone/menaquinone biosynthesis C-methylase UbiE